MAFESLSKRLNGAFRSLAGKSKLTQANMEDMLKEVRVALLEADVNYRVTKDFLEKVRVESIGQKVLESVEPSEMIVKIIHDEIVALLGDNEATLSFKEEGITTIMMVGLQGTGKTTTSGKLASLMTRKMGRKPLLVAADLVRPAAIEQLKTLGQAIGVEVFSKGQSISSTETVKLAMQYAKENHFDTVLIDTAGRLHIDELLMNELKDIQQLVNADEILLTVDAMTGQDIVQVAKTFAEQLPLTGLVVTKFDGDSRGGGVLSVRSITNVPVKFVGQGEKIEDIDVFYPDRMANRILGMGDIVTLVEQAQEKLDVEASEKAAKKMMDGTFTMDDMLQQYEQISKMGPLSGIMKMIPGMSQLTEAINDDDAEKGMKKQKAIIQSMTMEERENPSIINSRRKNRIAKGSGTTPQEVSKVVSSFEKMKTVMNQMSRIKNSGFDFSKLMGGK